MNFHHVLNVAVLTLYLRDVLLFEENLATILYHIFVMICYLTPVLGAILADTYLDKFRFICLPMNKGFSIWNSRSPQI